MPRTRVSKDLAERIKTIQLAIASSLSGPPNLLIGEGSHNQHGTLQFQPRLKRAKVTRELYQNHNLKTGRLQLYVYIIYIPYVYTQQIPSKHFQFRTQRGGQNAFRTKLLRSLLLATLLLLGLLLLFLEPRVKKHHDVLRIIISMLYPPSRPILTVL